MEDSVEQEVITLRTNLEESLRVSTPKVDNPNNRIVEGNYVLNEILDLMQKVTSAHQQACESENYDASPRTQFSKGIRFIETMQARMEEYNEMLLTKEQFIAQILTENENLKRQKDGQSNGVGVGSLERLKATFSNMRNYFAELVKRMEHLPVDPVNLEQVQKQKDLQGFKGEVEQLFYQVKNKLKCWKLNQNEMEEEMEATWITLERLNEMVDAVQSLRNTQDNAGDVEMLETGSANEPTPVLLNSGRSVIVTSTHSAPDSAPINLDVQPGPSRLAMANMKPATKVKRRKGNKSSSKIANSVVSPQGSSSSSNPNAQPAPPNPTVSSFETIQQAGLNNIPTTIINGAGITSLPPSHVHHVIHPALPQTQDIPLRMQNLNTKSPEGPGTQPIPPQPKPSNMCGLCGMSFHTVIQLKLHHSVVHAKATTTKKTEGVILVPPTQAVPLSIVPQSTPVVHQQFQNSPYLSPQPTGVILGPQGQGEQQVYLARQPYQNSPGLSFSPSWESSGRIGFEAGSPHFQNREIRNLNEPSNFDSFFGENSVEGFPGNKQ